MKVTAEDADDTKEGENAKITYTIQVLIKCLNL